MNSQIQENLEHEIVVADDNPDHSYLFKSALAKIGVLNMMMLSDGHEVIEYVKHSQTKPSIIFLDLNMPVKDGFDVLRELKVDPHYRTIPIVITTSSENELDINKCYALGANSYIVKPMNASEFDMTVQEIARYWITVSMLPNPTKDML